MRIMAGFLEITSAKRLLDPSLSGGLLKVDREDLPEINGVFRV